MILYFLNLSSFRGNGGEQEAAPLPCPSPPDSSLNARSQRKNGGVTMDGLEIAAVTEVISGGGVVVATLLGRSSRLECCFQRAK